MDIQISVSYSSSRICSYTRAQAQIFPICSQTESPLLSVALYLVSEGLSSDLSHVLVFFLPLLRILDSKAISEDLSDGLKRHTLAFRIAEHDEDPAEEADTTVETKGARGSHAFHHGEEGGRDDDVGRPASDRVEHSAESSYLQRDQLCANPRDGRDTRAEEGHVADDADKDQVASPAHIVRLHNQVLVDRDPVEGDCCKQHANSHSQYSDFKDGAASEAVDKDKIDQREDEVGSRDNDCDGSGVAEADDLK